MAVVKDNFLSTSEATYGILSDTLIAEMDRFWSRFNIFAAVQIAGIAAYVSTNPSFSYDNSVVIFAFILVMSWSFVGLITAVRGHDLQRAIVLTILDHEKNRPEESRYVESVLKKTFLPRYVNNFACIGFCTGCVVFWIYVACWGT